MTLFPRKSAIVITFRPSAPDGVWQVTRDGVLTSDYAGRGEAIRAACVAARAVEAHGGSAQVLLPPGDAIVRHREPQLETNADESPAYSLLADRPR